MAELLIRVVDKPAHPDPYVDIQQSKRGDVIAVVPDGWAWSERERTNPEWRIVRVPGLTVAAAEELMTPDSGDRRVNRMIRWRRKAFDLEHAGLRAKDIQALQDNARSVPVIKLSAAIGRALIKTKPPADDPAVIG